MITLKKIKEKVTYILMAVTLFFFSPACGQQTKPPANPPQGQGQQQEQEQGQQQAQNFSDEELRGFVKANTKAMMVQQQFQEEIISSIQEEDNLTLERFNEIAEAQQQKQNIEDVEASAKEKEAFTNITEEIQKKQPEAEQRMRAAIEEEIPVAKFEQIMMAYQQDPALQARINQLAQEEMTQGGQGSQQEQPKQKQDQSKQEQDQSKQKQSKQEQDQKQNQPKQ